jgi:uroporphyrinogen-III synthase
VSIADAGTVLVTRSEPGASELAEALGKASYAVRQCSVLEIRPIDDPVSGSTIAALDRFDAAICVSGHAVRLAFDLVDAAWKQRPEVTWIAVGAATARALVDRGVTPLRPVKESSEGILALAPLSRPVGKRVLICAGRGGRPLLAEELVRRGAEVTSLALYKRVPVPGEHAARQLGDASVIGRVIVSSADGARAFAAVWRAVGGNERVVVVAPSARVAVELNGLGFQHVVVADGAGAAATIEALRNIDEASK